MSHGSVATKRYKRIGHSEPFDFPSPGLMTGHQKRRPLARNETCSIACQSPDRIPSANKEGTCHPTSVAAATSQQTAGCAMALRPQLTVLLDEIFGSQPMSHWYETFNNVHVPFSAVREPQEVVTDLQLRANDIVVPLEGRTLRSASLSFVGSQHSSNGPSRMSLQKSCNSWKGCLRRSVNALKVLPTRKPALSLDDWIEH
jgi:crotonobetainyl-CoA:carnitine CoA-transferase CaiB-like acyl-CoA transferase